MNKNKSKIVLPILAKRKHFKLDHLDEEAGGGGGEGEKEKMKKKKKKKKT